MWRVSKARKQLMAVDKWEEYFTKILYRPFDIRHIYFHDSVVWRTRKEIMPNMMQENMALCVGRAGQVVGLEKPWNLVFCSEYIEDFNLFYRGGNVNFPFYLYPDTDKKELFSHKKKPEKRQPNINPKFFECLSKIYNKQVGQTFLSDISEKDISQGTDRNVCSTSADGLIIKRRKLPHWTLGGATYFVTFRTLQRELSVDEQKIVLEHVKEGEGKFYELIAEVVMPDHTHILLSPLKGYGLSRIMKGVKGVSAHKINQLRKTKGNVWQDESYDRIIRDQKELDEKLNYMLNNPLKKGLTDDPWNYHGWYFNERYNEMVGQTFLSDNNKQAGQQVDQTFLSDLSDLSDHEDKQECLSYQVFCYIYAILYSNIYRTEYAEFLKIDFPRIPFTKDYNLFSKMGECGKRLVDLHLLKSSELDPPVAKFQGKGDDKVEKLRYDEKERRVYINPNQYFEGIIKDVQQYQIGGYQVCDKWLKDRKGRTLSLDDIKHYCKVVTSLSNTIEIQKAIDDIYPEVEKETVEFDV
jgi:REP element-mobilizing transposase RayT